MPQRVISLASSPGTVYVLFGLLVVLAGAMGALAADLWGTGKRSRRAIFGTVTLIAVMISLAAIVASLRGTG